MEPKNYSFICLKTYFKHIIPVFLFKIVLWEYTQYRTYNFQRNIQCHGNLFSINQIILGWTYRNSCFLLNTPIPHIHSFHSISLDLILQLKEYLLLQEICRNCRINSTRESYNNRFQSRSNCSGRWLTAFAYNRKHQQSNLNSETLADE